MAKNKFDKLKIVCTAIGNEIVIGEAESASGELVFLKNKSEDRTNEAIKAVMQFFQTLHENNEGSAARVKGVGELRFTPENELEEDGSDEE